MDDGQINALCSQLQSQGSAMSTDAQGRKLMLVYSTHLSFVDPTTPSLLVAYEGEGAFLYEISAKVSTFRLIEAGFGLRLAPTLADVLNRLAERLRDVSEGTRLPMLSAPRGQREKED